MKIMLVDDEPIFIDEMKRIISDYSAEFNVPIHIVSEVYSVQEALKAIPIHLPDIVFTDIKMSSINGIELSKIIQKQWPDIIVVIISGYPSFEYARDALRANVLDYLLKPIEPIVVKGILDRLNKITKDNKYKESKDIIAKIIFTDNQDLIKGEDILQKIHYNCFSVFLIQKIEPPTNINDPFLPQTELNFGEYVNKINEHLDDNETAWIFNSKDQRETIVIFGLSQYRESNMQKIQQITSDYFSFGGFPITIAISGEIRYLAKIINSLKQLKTFLYRNLVIGKSKNLDLSLPQKTVGSHTSISGFYENKLSLLILKKEWNSLKNDLTDLFQVWKNEDCPSIFVENNLKKIVQIFDKNSQELDVIDSKNLETRVEEIVCTASSFEEAAEYFWDMLINIFKLDLNEKANQNKAENLFDTIKTYLTSNINEPITLSQLSDIFQVSRTYLCNLFRNISEKSFVEYFTSLRMEKAKQLIREYPDMLLKDIAETVGYIDHHYFSRVFKTIVGKTPTEYKESE